MATDETLSFIRVTSRDMVWWCQLANHIFYSPLEAIKATSRDEVWWNQLCNGIPYQGELAPVTPEQTELLSTRLREKYDE